MIGHERTTLCRRSAWAAVTVAVWAVLMPTSAAADDAKRPRPPQATLAADKAEVSAARWVSAQAQQLADTVAATGDHADAPFIIVDKKQARVLVFDAQARLLAHSAVLLGAALGDDSVPDIGNRPMAQILPAERTTPAGRFVGERGRNVQGEDIIWVDYDAAVSMHRVRTTKASERRAQRLATPTISDNRISYGCINVPVAFYERYVQPVFAERKAMVYVLPDIKLVEQVFGPLKTSPTRVPAVAGPAPGGFTSASGWLGESSR